MSEKMTHLEDYVFVIKDGQECEHIRIKTGPYEGVIYQYKRNSIKYIPERNKEPAMYVFTFEVIDSGNHDLETLIEDKNFHNELGLILDDLITRAVRKNATKNGLQ